MANMYKKSWSRKWVVVKFTDTKDFSVLPVNWLVETETEKLTTSNIKFCKWPPVRSVTSDDLKKAETPDESWVQYPIKVLGRNTTYGSFSKAWDVKVFETDNEEEKCQTRKRLLSVSSDSDEDNIGFDIESISANNIQKQSVCQSEETIFTNLEPVQLQQTYDYGNLSYTSDATPIAGSSASKLNPDIQQAQNYEDLNVSSLTSFILTDNHSAEALPSTSDGLESIFKKIHSELLANRMMHERLWNQMDSLKSEFANIKHKMLPGLLFSNDSKDIEFLEQFPFYTKESVLACEQILQTDDNVKEKFKHFLHSVGGMDAKSHTRRILTKLFSNKFAINCSWTGRAFEKNISKFRIQNLQIISLMKCVIKNDHQQTSDANFENDVQSWFRTAKTRFDREN